MYVLKARRLLTQRYTVHFLDHVQTVTRPVFATPCSYINTVMRAPLRERIQNAINKAINNDCNNNNSNNNNCYNTLNYNYNICSNAGDNNKGGVLIVGGRRRNRKKRAKKNAPKKKKSPSLDSIKNKLSPKSCRKGTDTDNAPLINQDKENVTTMPLFGKKKKPAPEPDTSVKGGEAINMENGGVDTTDGATVNKAQNEVPETDGTTAVPAEKGVDEKTTTFAPAITDDPKTEVKQDGGQPPAAGEANGQSTAVKTEKSPLIGQLEPQEPNVKESKLRDHSPGLLCCSIL